MKSIVTDKIEVVRCPQGFNNIPLILADINRFFYEAEQYQFAKEYRYSIFYLKKAFEKTFELREKKEQVYAKLFRTIITESLKNIHEELKKMTSGFLRRHQFRGSCLMAEETLELFKQDSPYCSYN